jgi:cell division protein FtsB
MSQYAPIVFLLSGGIVLTSLLFGDQGISNLNSLKHTLEVQEKKNIKLHEYVGELKHEISSIRNDPRALEKAARNELGLARPGELIFIFDE